MYTPTWAAEPGSPSEDALKLLASWAATPASEHAPETETEAADRDYRPL